MSEDVGRGLSDSFFEDLKNGDLQWVTDRVKNDRTLCLEIREDYINVYYRGGSLFAISKCNSPSLPYSITFDIKYAKGITGITFPEHSDLKGWKQSIPQLKDCMDLWFGKHPKTEREFQQLVVRDNNSPEENDTDYFICDIEYDNRRGARFDLIGVCWPSTPVDRKNTRDLRLSFIEKKYGDGAVCGTAGLSKHLADIADFIEEAGALDELKYEMKTLFNQKRELGLVNSRKNIESFAENPEVLLLLANHDPAKSALQDEFTLVKEQADRLGSMSVPVRFIRSSFCGYGIYDDMTVDYREVGSDIQAI